MNGARLWPAMAAGSALAAMGAVVYDIENPLRGALVAWFLLVCPGATVVGLLRITDPLLGLTAAVAISLEIGVSVAQALLFFGLWSPVLGLGVLSAVTIAIAVTSVISSTDMRTAFNRDPM